MAIYRNGKASMAANGVITGTGTAWQTSLALIRVGATIMFFTGSAVSLATISDIVSDTQLRATNTDGNAVASTDYVILLHDSLTVDGLAQDIAEALKYYQGQESNLAGVIDFLNRLDMDQLEQWVADIKAAEVSTAADRSAVTQMKADVAADKADVIQLKVDTQTIKTETNQIKTDTGALKVQAEQAEAGAVAAKNAAETAAGSIDTSKIMMKDQNLNDVSDKNQARTNLSLYQKSELYTKTEIDAKTTELQSAINAAVDSGKWLAWNDPIVTAFITWDSGMTATSTPPGSLLVRISKYAVEIAGVAQRSTNWPGSPTIFTFSKFPLSGVVSAAYPPQYVVRNNDNGIVFTSAVDSTVATNIKCVVGTTSTPTGYYVRHVISLRY